MKQFLTSNPNQTIDLAEKITKALPNQLNVILLEGDLSFGKTTFTKGVGKGLQVKGIINSPTFTILKEYQGTKKLNHIDLYRLDSIGSDFDLEEYINDPESITVIEWPNQVSEFIPERYVKIIFEYIDQSKRKITVETINYPSNWEDLINE